MSANFDIHEFLAESKKISEKVGSSLDSSVHLVVGNESCDLDSVVSALIYAYYLFRRGTKLVVPILNIPKRYLSIKTEVVYFLKQNSICLNHLSFRDAPIFSSLPENPKLSITLVDHHVLPQNNKFMKPFVTRILDHRPFDDSERWDKTQLHESLLEPVGSCCTHVAQTVINDQPHILDRTISKLLYGTILLDTANLSPKANRTNPQDIDVLSKLRARHPDLESNDDLFQSLVDAKSDVSSLTCEQLMLKDLKITKHGVPIVGLPILVVDFLAKSSNIKQTLDTFLAENQASILLLMGLKVGDNVLQRDLGVYGLEQAYPKVKEIIQMLESNTEPCLDLHLVSDEFVKVFTCKNVQVSRKQILPLIEKLFH